MTEGYAQAIDIEQMERQLARCSAHDDEHPPTESDARRVALSSVCPCVLSEESICNALTTAVCEELHVSRG